MKDDVWIKNDKGEFIKYKKVKKRKKRFDINTIQIIIVVTVFILLIPGLFLLVFTTMDEKFENDIITYEGNLTDVDYSVKSITIITLDNETIFTVYGQVNGLQLGHYYIFKVKDYKEEDKTDILKSFEEVYQGDPK